MISLSNRLTRQQIVTNSSLSVRPLKLRMSLDVHSLQSLIHDIPTWAQYAAQGISEEAIAGQISSRVTYFSDLLHTFTLDRSQSIPDFPFSEYPPHEPEFYFYIISAQSCSSLCWFR